jgi:hypothetical protein
MSFVLKQLRHIIILAAKWSAHSDITRRHHDVDHPHMMPPLGCNSGYRLSALIDHDPDPIHQTYFVELFFSVLFNSFAMFKCCSSVGSVLDANCLILGSEPLSASVLNSLTSC